MRMKHWWKWIELFLGMLFSLGLAASPLLVPSDGAVGTASTPATAQLLWRTDLRTIGYRKLKGWDEKKVNWWSNLLAFTDEDTLVAGFITLDGPVKRLPTPGRLHAAFLEAETGQVRTTREWPLRSSIVAELWAGADGKLLVRADHIVRLYAEDFVELKQRRIGQDKDEGYRPPYVRVSPSGRSLLTYGLGRDQINVIDTDTLEVRESRTDENVWVTSLNDSHVAGVSAGTGSEPLIRKLGSEWQPVASAVPTGCSVPYFLNDATITLMGVACSSVVVVGLDGQLLLADELGRKYSVGKDVYPSRDQRRLAVVVAKWKGITIESLDMYKRPVPEQVVIYDLQIRRPIYSLRTKLLSEPGLQLALSPDGSLLAIARDGIVEVYTLPHKKPSE